MIDTIRLRHRALLPPSRVLRECGFSKKAGHSLSDSHRISWVRNYNMSNGVCVRLTWSSAPWGDWLNVEGSLTKLLYANNVRLIDDADVQRALGLVSQIVYEVTGTHFNAHTALVGRVDYCHNFEVGEANIIPYISAVSGASRPAMMRQKTNDTTVAFQNKSKKVQLYGKRAEVLCQGNATTDELQAALGILRYEVSYFKSAGCISLANNVGVPDRLAGYLLVSGIAYEALSKELAALGLDRRIVPVDARLDILRENFGDTPHFRQLVAYQCLRDRFGEKLWQDGIGGYSRSSAYRYERELRAVGVLLKAECQLPPLRLIRTAQGIETA